MRKLLEFASEGISSSLALALVIADLLSSPVWAEEAQHGDHEEEHAKEHHEFHKNVVGVFVGITGEDRRDRAFTLGLEYE